MKIVILSLIICFFAGCSEPEPDWARYKLIISNKTVASVSLLYKPYYNLPFTKTLIQADSSFIIIQDTEVEPIPFYSDTVIINFTDKEKIYTDNDTSSRNPMLLSNYNQKGSFEYIYTITEQDYLDADSIK